MLFGRFLPALFAMTSSPASNPPPPPPPPPTTGTTEVSTTELLSAIIDAARHGAVAIRRAANNSAVVVQLYKQPGDARSALTAADVAAQRVVCGSLRHLFFSSSSSSSLMTMVGEEDGTVQWEDPATQAAIVPLDTSLVVSQDAPLALGPSSSRKNGVLPPPEHVLDWNEIAVFVDPLDGTREFVEGRLANVQCLIGVTHRGRPLLGAIGLPFVEDEESVHVVYGWVGTGVGRVKEEDTTTATSPGLVRPRLVSTDPGSTFPNFDADQPLTLTTGDSTSPLLRHAVNVIEQLFPSSSSSLQREIQGACGNKLLRVAHGTATLSVLHHTTCLWDTAAPSAILMALGGTVTDLLGQPLLYDGYQRGALGNRLGVLCSMPGAQSLHTTICQAMRANANVLEATIPQVRCSDGGGGECVDIVRDVDGVPLSVQFFQDCMVDIPPLASYSCPENEAVRGLMSNACRVYLHPAATTATTRRYSVFYKRIDFAQLDHAREKLHTAPHKLLRDVRSYRVETSFLSSAACAAVISRTGLHIPQCWHADLRPNGTHPIESKFSILLQDFAPADGWSQRWLLRTREECHATLRTFAKLHAYFWKGSHFWTRAETQPAAAELTHSVWESASYVQPALQTKNQCRQVQSAWLQKRENCREELQDFAWWDTLGERLENVAEHVGKEAHPFHASSSTGGDYEAYKTLIHGDPKQTNIFFRKPEETTMGDDPLELDVGLIDFQWAGFGLAASDIAHHLVAAVHADLLEGEGENELLRYYYDQLTVYLVEYGAYANVEEVNEKYSFEAVFLRQYETAVLDLCRLVIAYAWSRFERVNDEAGFARTMNKNSYNKSLPNVIWLMQRCDALLTKRSQKKM